MCLKHGARMIAAVATIAALAAPAAASASAIAAGGDLTGLQVADSHSVQPSPSSGSSDLELIAIAGGTVIVAGAGLAGSRRRAHRRSTAARTHTA